MTKQLLSVGALTSDKYCPFNLLNNPEKIALIWLNSPLSGTPPDDWISLWNRSRLRYCTDGAANHIMILCKEKRVKPPHLIAGDFDSISAEAKEYFIEKCCKLVHVHEQDSTDLTKTLKLVIKAVKDDRINVQAITLLGGLHGRFDHVFGALNAVILHNNANKNWKLPVLFVDHENIVTILDEGTTSIELDVNYITRICGLIPICQRKTIVSTSGFRWNLENQELQFGGIVSSSNEIIDEQKLEIITNAPIKLKFAFTFFHKVMYNALRLSSRGLLRIGGSEAEQFLQGLITKDINCVHICGVIYSFLLNARGRIFSDLLIYKVNGINGLVLETDAGRLATLERTLVIYRMRRKIEIESLKQHSVFFSVESPPKSYTNAYADPRVHTFGYRIINDALPSSASSTTENDYVQRRLEWGFAEGFDEVGDQIPLQLNGDLLNGISFEKGCYIGQELIARTHHTGMIRRRVLPIRCANNGSKIFGKNLVDENKKRQGKVLRTMHDSGIALVALNFLGKTLHDEAGQLVEVMKPKWWPERMS